MSFLEGPAIWTKTLEAWCLWKVLPCTSLTLCYFLTEAGDLNHFPDAQTEETYPLVKREFTLHIANCSRTLWLILEQSMRSHPEPWLFLHE